MKKWNKSLIAIATALCLGATGLTVTASAQQNNDTNVQCDRPGPNRPGKKAEKMDSTQWKQMVEQRNADLYAKLKLSSNQESAWKAYTESTLKNVPPSKPAKEDMEKLTAPERMQKALDMTKEKQARMEEHLKAVKTFYATLTAEQQKIFDTETMPKSPRDKGADRGNDRGSDRGTMDRGNDRRERRQRN